MKATPQVSMRWLMVVGVLGAALAGCGAASGSGAPAATAGAVTSTPTPPTLSPTASVTPVATAPPAATPAPTPVLTPPPTSPSAPAGAPAGVALPNSRLTPGEAFPNVAVGQVCTSGPTLTLRSTDLGGRTIVVDVSWLLEQLGTRREEASLASLMRDIFGNPFRPVTFDPAWLTADVLALARQMYDSREFSAMPILADALQDAGCTNEDVLNHCRDAAEPHVRGCWVVDLLLGKE